MCPLVIEFTCLNKKGIKSMGVLVVTGLGVLMALLMCLK